MPKNYRENHDTFYRTEETPKTFPPLIEPEELKAILAWAPNDFRGVRNVTMCKIIYCQGVSLTWLNNKFMYGNVIRTEAGIAGIILPGERRWINEIVVPDLKRYEDLIAREDLGQPLDTPGVPYFRNKNGEPVTENGHSIRRNFGNYAKKAGYDDVNFTSLRVSCAERELRNGMDKLRLSNRMGMTVKWLNNIEEYFNVPTEPI